jgi:hypothetical protein
MKYVRGQLRIGRRIYNREQSIIVACLQKGKLCSSVSAWNQSGTARYSFEREIPSCSRLAASKIQVGTGACSG